jgi:hypothetical protein
VENEYTPVEGVDALGSWRQVYLTHVRYADYGPAGTAGFLVHVDLYYEDRPDHLREHRFEFEVRTTLRKSPFGEWELTLPNTALVGRLFEHEVVEDLMLVIAYSGYTQAWPR